MTLRKCTIPSACDCNSTGTVEGTTCDPFDGVCTCKEGVGGRQCDICLSGSVGFSESGCQRELISGKHHTISLSKHDVHFVILFFQGLTILGLSLLGLRALWNITAMMMTVPIQFQSLTWPLMLLLIVKFFLSEILIKQSSM